MSPTLDTTVPIRILALAIIPTKIVVGICFPSYPIAHRCPHISMLLQDWGPEMANKVILAISKTTPFAEMYQELKVYGRNRGPERIVKSDLVITEEEDGTQECFLVLIPQPVTIKGQVREFF